MHVTKYKSSERKVNKHTIRVAYHDSVLSFHCKWFEPRGNMRSCSLIVQVSVVLRSTVVGSGN